MSRHLLSPEQHIRMGPMRRIARQDPPLRAHLLPLASPHRWCWSQWKGGRWKHMAGWSIPQRLRSKFIVNNVLMIRERIERSDN